MNKYVTNLTLPNGTNVLIKDSECRTNLSNEIRRATAKETELEEADTHLRNDLTTETNARKQSENKNNAEIAKIHSNITAIENKNTEQDNEITTIHSDITDIENKNTEQDNEISTLRTMISSPYNFRGDVANISSLPASGEVNDTYYVQDVKYKVTWTGSAWVQSSLSEADYQTELGELKGDIANLINNYDIINVQCMKGRFLSKTGEIFSLGGSDLYAVDIECVKPNTTVYIECTVNQYLPVICTFHDINGDFISKIDCNVATVTQIKKLINIPENCYFIKFNGYTSNNFKFGTLKNNLIDSYEPLYPQYLKDNYVINIDWELQSVGNGYGCYSIPCGKNDLFVISGKSTEHIPIFALKNKNGVIIENYSVSKDGVDSVITNKIITVPEDNCTLYVNCSNYNFQPIKKLNYENNKTIYVDSNGFGDFTTFREATEYCRSHEKTTVIVRTACNLVTEYGEDYFNNIPSAYDHNHSIGPECGFNCTYKFAQGAKLLFNYEGTNPLVAEMFSPVNIVGSCTFENMEIECKNCRYCVHEDTPTVLDVVPWYYAVTYKNCNMQHNGNTVGSYRNTACIGAGSSPYSTTIIENGVYKAINGIASITYHLPSMHSNTNSKVIIKNIYADGKVQTSDFGGGDNGKLEVEVSGCSLSENLYFGTKTNYTEWNNIVRR